MQEPNGNQAPTPPDDQRIAQVAHGATRDVLAIELPKFKTELHKESAQLVKQDFSGAALGGQILKFDQSLLKWDEKGLTFAGKEVKSFKKLSLQQLVHGKTIKEEAEAKKAKEATAKQELLDIKESTRTAAKEAQEAKKGAEKASRSAQQSVSDAAKAKHEAEIARNLAGSARRETQLAARSSSSARENAERARKSSDQTRKVAKEFLRAMQQVDRSAGGTAKNVDHLNRLLAKLENTL
ncbi:hypothetical protein AB0A70_09985 [Streptomyces morookaense]|uniref:hypothetical protein n=1 Tax=Streptomyces morookaense TaxID=1970 RepID=UPI0033C09980